jgi:hypothetical protein
VGLGSFFSDEVAVFFFRAQSHHNLEEREMRVEEALMKRMTD